MSYEPFFIDIPEQDVLQLKERLLRTGYSTQDRARSCRDAHQPYTDSNLIRKTRGVITKHF